MNVKITYTIPLEEVPEKIDDLLDEVSKSLHILAQQVKPDTYREVDNASKKLNTINAVRKKMVSVDLLLDDCYTILAGYEKTLADLRVSRMKGEQETDGTIFKGGSSDDPAESNNR